MTQTQSARVVYQAEPGDDYLEFRPVKLSQRIAAAAMAIAFVPIVATLIRFAVVLGFQAFVSDTIQIWQMPWYAFVLSVLTVTSASFVFSWIGFLFLVPMTHRKRPERYLRSWLATAGLGAGIGLGLGTVLGILFAFISGDLAVMVVIPACAAYGALFGVAYWALLRLFYARRLPPVEDVFA